MPFALPHKLSASVRLRRPFKQRFVRVRENDDALSQERFCIWVMRVALK